MKRIEIIFTDSATHEFVGGYNAPFKKIDLIRNKYSKYVKIYKMVMTNTLRRAGILIGCIKTKIRVYQVK